MVFGKGKWRRSSTLDPGTPTVSGIDSHQQQWTGSSLSGGVTGSSSATETITDSPVPTTATSGSLLLTITSPTTISPGSMVRGQAALPTSVLENKDTQSLKLVLSGKCGATIMSRQRAAANAIGGGAGGAGLITYRESHTFLRSETVAWQSSPDQFTSSSIYMDTKKAGRATFNFEIQVPLQKSCNCPSVYDADKLPPSCDLRNIGSGQPVDGSTIDAFYTFSAVVERKGLFRKNPKAKVDLEMVEDEPPGYDTQLILEGTSRSPTKYAAKHADAPDVECRLSIVPPMTKGGYISYKITYRVVAPLPPDENTPPSPVSPKSFPQALSMSPTFLSSSWRSTEEDLSHIAMPPIYPTFSNSNISAHSAILPQLNPRLEVALVRQCTTRPVERPADGLEYHFPSYTLCLGKNAPEGIQYHGSGEDAYASIDGVIKVPDKEVSIVGDAKACNAEIRHHLTARLMSDKVRRPVMLKVPVFLPSSTN